MGQGSGAQGGQEGGRQGLPRPRPLPAVCRGLGLLRGKQERLPVTRAASTRVTQRCPLLKVHPRPPRARPPHRPPAQSAPPPPQGPDANCSLSFSQSCPAPPPALLPPPQRLGCQLSSELRSPKRRQKPSPNQDPAKNLPAHGVPGRATSAPQTAPLRWPHLEASDDQQGVDVVLANVFHDFLHVALGQRPAVGDSETNSVSAQTARPEVHTLH